MKWSKPNVDWEKEAIKANKRVQELLEDTREWEAQRKAYTDAHIVTLNKLGAAETYEKSLKYDLEELRAIYNVLCKRHNKTVLKLEKTTAKLEKRL